MGLKDHCIAHQSQDRCELGILLAKMIFNMSDLQYQAVYNILSFTLASMSSTTMYLWFRASAVSDKYKSAVYISGLVTYIVAYHYIRIFNSWVDAYSYEGVPNGQRPSLTGVPFNDAYRYMDWLLTVPLLLIEILLVMKLEGDNFSSKAWTLGVGSALMIVSGYYVSLWSLVISLPAGCAGSSLWAFSCTSCMGFLWVLLLPPPAKPIHKLPGKSTRRK